MFPFINLILERGVGRPCEGAGGQERRHRPWRPGRHGGEGERHRLHRPLLRSRRDHHHDEEAEGII